MSAPGRGLDVSVIVRDARPAELAAIGDLRVAAYCADGFLTPASQYTQTLRALGTDGGGEVLAAIDGPLIVGTVMLEVWPLGGPVVQQPGEAGIRALAVAPDARGRGVGRALLAAVTRRAAERGTRHLVLLTGPEMQAAQHLYAEAGFGRLPDRDWHVRPGVELLAFGRELAAG
jgi:ribosomal protein S18 acetylase RimI-like enzyme